MKISDTYYIAAFVAFIIIKSAHAQQPCNITLKATKPSARSASIAGVNFSTKQLSALRSVCNVEIKHLTKAEKVRLYEEKLSREEADIAAMSGN